MTTPHQYRAIDDVVYDTDITKIKIPRRKDDTFYEYPKTQTGQQYQIIKTVDTNDPTNSQGYPSNGFQGMAVAPVIDGKPDFSKTIVAFAGTYNKDPKDIQADVQDVVFGQKNIDSQFASAEQFYQEVNKMKGVTIVSTTGHSLGGAQSQKVSSAHHIPAVTFSTASPIGQLSPIEMAWINGKGKSSIINFMHRGDQVSGLTVAKILGTTVFASEFSDGSFFSGHMLKSYRFDKNGNVELDSHLIRGASKEAVLRHNQAATTALTSGGKVALQYEQAVNYAKYLDDCADTVESIRYHNDKIPAVMEKAHHDVKSKMYDIPFVTASDVEECDERNRLQPKHHYSADKVATQSKKLAKAQEDLLELKNNVLIAADNRVLKDQQDMNLFG